MCSVIEDLLDIGNFKLPNFYPNKNILDISKKSNIFTDIDKKTSYELSLLNKKEKIKFVHNVTIVNNNKFYVTLNDEKIYFNFDMTKKWNFKFDDIDIDVSFENKNNLLVSKLEYKYNERVYYHTFKKWKKIVESYIYDIEDYCYLYYELNDGEFDEEYGNINDSDESEDDYEYLEYEPDCFSDESESESEDEDIEFNVNNEIRSGKKGNRF